MKSRTGTEMIRESAIQTTKGLILYSEDGETWTLNFPDGETFRGGISPEKIAIFFNLIGSGCSVEDARETAFLLLRTRGKYAEERKRTFKFIREGIGREEEAWLRP